ncbi:MAG: PspC domain-containing protein [Firmicutes bacterium]|nr:PspC domain-containing protein [Bacillota bacterium]
MEPKRLYRSRTDRVFGGVAGGLAAYFNVDVVVIRLLWILSLSIGGGLVYLIAWFIIPEEDDTPDRTEGQTSPEDEERQWRRGGIILIVVGLFFLWRALFPWPRFRDFAPFFLIILGIIMLFSGLKRNR